MKLWVARNVSGSLWLFDNVPFLDGKCWYPQIDSEAYIAEPYLYPEITLENSPQQIEIEDLCKVCALRQIESHCVNEEVPNLCLKCSFNCYSKKKLL